MSQTTTANLNGFAQSAGTTGNGEADGTGDAAASSDSGSWLTSIRSRLGMDRATSLRDTLENALKQGGESAEAFSSQERDMLLRILRFGALRVEDVMVPRADIIAIDERLPLAELLRVFDEAGHSRLPVYRETLDDLKGMIHIKDVVNWLCARIGVTSETLDIEGAVEGRATPALTADAASMADDGQDDVASEPPAEGSSSAASARSDAPSSRGPATAAAQAGRFAQFDLTRLDLSHPITQAKLRREVLFVPPSMPAVNLLLRMQSTRVHLAMVVDEYGGTDGLVSIEDLVEEIVGAIEDEHDEGDEDLIQKDPRGGFIAAARAPIDELEALLERRLRDVDDEEDVDTLGGLVFTIAGRVPVRGELVRHRSGIEFEVLDADPRRIKKLRVHLSRRGAKPGARSAVAAPAAGAPTAPVQATPSGAGASGGKSTPSSTTDNGTPADGDRT